MDGRTWLGIALLLVPAGCSRRDLDVGRQVAVESAIAERPSIREIFRDGRYSFLPAPPGLKRWAQRRLDRTPHAREGMDKLSLRVVRAEDGGGPIMVFAMVLSDLAVADPMTWDGFMRGLSEVADTHVGHDELDDVKTAYVSVPEGRTLALYYAPDLIIRMDALPETPRQELEDLARYLLEAR